MNRYCLIFPPDQRHNNWVFSRDLVTGRTIRERYAHLPCPNRKCGKFDELKAVRELGIDPDLRIRAKGDFVGTDDGFPCFSHRLLEAMRAAGVGGFEIVPLPADPEYVLALPTVVATTDPDTCGMQYTLPCRLCSRFGSSSRWPTMQSIVPPGDVNALFIPSTPFESIISRKFYFYASASVVSLMKEFGTKRCGFEEV